MPYRNGVAYYGAYGGGDNTASQAQNSTTSRQLSESTKKLFGAIDDENLEAFKQAIAEGANVNAFDKGYTPLMTIIINNDDSPICLKMMMLLLQHQSLNINAQETKKRNTALHLAFLMENKDFVQMLLRHPELDINVENDCYVIGNRCTPRKYIEQIGENQKKDFSYLTMEITKAQKGKELLAALSSGNIYQAKRLLNQELNPNHWKRNQNGKVETPLSLIIKSCLQGITQDNEEVLTKLLKHKDLDFSHERYAQLKQIIGQAITGRLTDTINSKDLNDVKKLVEDNCFINRAIVTAALRDASEPTESVKNYLNEKFSASAVQPLASMNNIPVDFEQFVQELVEELGKTKTQLAETEQELDRIVREKANWTKDLNQEEQKKMGQRTRTLADQVNQLTKENAQLRTQNQSLNDKNEKSSQAISSGRKLSNYASACFILLGVYTVVACLVIEDYPGIISAFFTAVALAFFY
ncbi:ankyrin repeat domain-containing protein [Wolbachia endosymbiont (group A) of Anomoia purmunda]|uniref:ankyrin repeat domain-containing protein n=1 Tax=Wolbachia endosymbiont (group A) of Anomoia purmunda TaxID=2953978 RepID=UPI00222EBC59|nr:ankyrin repeat domain-containing protein [Wolbachia endosymbiont (group A) of Anomoia purmunda]